MKYSPRFFTDDELSCRHCGENKMDMAFVEKLDKIRSELGIPMIVNSAYRCPEHNQAVSSTGPKGPHTTGRAVDISAKDGRKKYMIMELAKKQGITRIGIAKTFIHLDDLTNMDGFPNNVIWAY